jgi:hypothetical protein
MEFDQTSAPAASPQPDARHRKLLLLLGLILFTGIVLILLLGLLLQRNGRMLYPFRATPTPIGLLVDGQAALVTFAELSENAAQYHNQRIQVTGDYLPLTESTCSPYNGPIIRWSLINGGLQLNAQGFEGVLSLVAPGTRLTVEGIWRLYAGPVGCGKQPPAGVVWYLQVERIIAPNPLLPLTRDPNDTLLPGVSTPPFPTPIPSRTPTPTPSRTATPTLGPTGTLLPTNPSTPGGAGTPTATASPDLTGTPTRIGTPPRSGPPTITPTRDPNASPTPTGTLTTTPGAQPTSPGGLPTSPPNPYPGPNPTLPPAPTNTPSGGGY